MKTFHVVKTAILAALLMASATPALASSPKAKGANVPAPTCHARFNQSRGNCTIVSSQCRGGHLPVAHPPACHCACQGPPPSMSSSKPKAPPR